MQGVSRAETLSLSMRFNLSTSQVFAATLHLLLIPSGVSAQIDSKLYELRGRVISTATSEPVPGALVQIAGQPARFSDSDGAFAFPDLPPGRVSLSARKPASSANSNWAAGSSPIRPLRFRP